MFVVDLQLHSAQRMQFGNLQDYCECAEQIIGRVTGRSKISRFVKIESHLGIDFLSRKWQPITLESPCSVPRANQLAPISDWYSWALLKEKKRDDRLIFHVLRPDYSPWKPLFDYLFNIPLLKAKTRWLRLEISTERETEAWLSLSGCFSCVELCELYPECKLSASDDL